MEVALPLDACSDSARTPTSTHAFSLPMRSLANSAPVDDVHDGIVDGTSTRHTRAATPLTFSASTVVEARLGVIDVRSNEPHACSRCSNPNNIIGANDTSAAVRRTLSLPAGRKIAGNTAPSKAESMANAAAGTAVVSFH